MIKSKSLRQSIFILLSMLISPMLSGQEESQMTFEEAREKYEAERKIRQNKRDENKSLLGQRVASSSFNNYHIYELPNSIVNYCITDEQFDVLFPLPYDKIERIGRGIVKVKSETKWGVLDIESLSYLLDLEYDDIINYEEGYFYVQKDGKDFYVDKEGNESSYFVVEKSEDELSRIKKGKLYGYSDDGINATIPVKYLYALAFSDGLAYVSDGQSKGYINANGELVLSTSEYGFFSEGVLAVKKDRKSGFIDKKGNLIIPYDYDDVYNFRNGMAGVKKEGKWGFVDKNNQPITPFKYDRVDDFSEGFAAVYLYDKMGYINLKGEVVIPIQYSSTYEDTAFKDGEAWVCLTNSDGYEKWGKIDTKGNTVIPIEYPFPLSKVEDMDNEFGFVRHNISWFLATKSPLSIKDISYEQVNSFDAGVARVGGNRWNLIDKYGSELLPNDYFKIGKFVDGIAMVQGSDGYGYINSKGEVIMKPEYYFALPFRNEVGILVDSNLNMIRVDTNGNPIE